MDIYDKYYKERELRIKLECELEFTIRERDYLKKEYDKCFDYFNTNYTDIMSEFLNLCDYNLKEK